MNTKPRTIVHGDRRAFSLVELLMAIFILGIGIISIATLFPAGIAQQQKAMDDQVGPLVARNAMSLLRSRIPDGSFGYVEIDSLNPPPWDVTSGDFPWLRPAVVVGGASNGPAAGALDVFNTHAEYGVDVTTVTENGSDPWIGPALTSYGGIPYAGHQNDDPSTIVDGIRAPLVVIEQSERQYPKFDDSGRAPRYYWDCMFRRAGDKVFVAVLVYRVQPLQGDQPPWAVQADAGGRIAVPWSLDLESGANDYQPWRVGQGIGFPEDRAQWILPNADAGDPYDPMVNDDCWQCPGQWLVDQNGIVNRVAIGRTRKDDPTTHVELAFPVPPMAEDSVHIPEIDALGFAYNAQRRVPQTGSLILPANARSDGDFVYSRGMVVPPDGGVVGGPAVSRLWYVPTGFTDGDGNEWNFTPVYILVEEL
ncbi:MAG: prepilin-type N-terminal cleavage/methylation domain-containing protein [Planctomycetota bacterium]|nr:prepilin-type N-terminal cleavage/methylation domain-containing protein [Planctomycetota bacterium]